MEDKLKIGDVVVLNSGGPDMTIESIEGDVATCWWMSWSSSALAASDVRKHEFPLACIKPALPKITDVLQPAQETR